MDRTRGRIERSLVGRLREPDLLLGTVDEMSEEWEYGVGMRTGTLALRCHGFVHWLEEVVDSLIGLGPPVLVIIRDDVCFLS
jgi:hypothetical protein